MEGRSEFHSVLDKIRRPVDVRYMDLEPKTRGKTLRVWHVNSIPSLRSDGRVCALAILQDSGRLITWPSKGHLQPLFIPCN